VCGLFILCRKKKGSPKKEKSHETPGYKESELAHHLERQEQAARGNKQSTGKRPSDINIVTHANFGNVEAKDDPVIHGEADIDSPYTPLTPDGEVNPKHLSNADQLDIHADFGHGQNMQPRGQQQRVGADNASYLSDDYLSKAQREEIQKRKELPSYQTPQYSESGISPKASGQDRVGFILEAEENGRSHNVGLAEQTDDDEEIVGDMVTAGYIGGDNSNAPELEEEQRPRPRTISAKVRPLPARPLADRPLPPRPGQHGPQDPDKDPAAKQQQQEADSDDDDLARELQQDLHITLGADDNDHEAGGHAFDADDDVYAPLSPDAMEDKITIGDVEEQSNDSENEYAPPVQSKKKNTAYSGNPYHDEEEDEDDIYAPAQATSQGTYDEDED